MHIDSQSCNFKRIRTTQVVGKMKYFMPKKHSEVKKPGRVELRNPEKTETMSGKKHRQLGFQELLLAFVLIGGSFSNQLTLLGLGTNFATIVFGLIAIAVLYGIVRNRRVVFTEIHCGLPLALLTMCLVLLVIKPGYSSIGFENVFIFVMLPFFIFLKELDAQKVLKYVLTLSVLLIPSAFLLISGTDETQVMPLSYAITTPVVAALVFIRYRMRRLTVYEKLLCLLAIFFFVCMFMYGKRGPVVVVAVCISVLMVKPPNENDGLTLKQVARALLLVLAGSLELILEWIAEILGHLGIEASSITRTLVLANTNYGIDASRSELYAAAFDFFIQSPLYGHGLGSFLYSTLYGQMQYPHNVVLQLLDDGGLVLMLLVSIPIIKAFFRMLASSDRNFYIIYILLFSIAIPHFMVSSDIFQQPELWCLLAYSHFINQMGKSNIATSRWSARTSRPCKGEFSEG